MKSHRRGHTLRDVRALLQERGLHTRSALGQCFLTDLNVLDLLIARGAVGETDLVLEVGSGTGSLTRRLADAAGFVISVEFDTGLFQLAQDTVADAGNVQLIHGDVLKNKNALNPTVLAAVRDRLAGGDLEHPKVIANLPYNVATPVIVLLLLSEIPWERFVVTIQKEVADRLKARPGTRDFGAVSVIVQALAEVELVRELPPSVFWPRPRVASAIVQIRPNATKRRALGDIHRLHRFVRSLMVHRRKNLRGAMRHTLSGVSKPRIDQLLGGMGLDPQSRAEELDVPQWIELSRRVAELTDGT